MIALRAAAALSDSYRLTGATLYVDGGVLGEECGARLRNFFLARRG